jgi:nucleotide-binding universal stress UspA family protein
MQKPVRRLVVGYDGSELAQRALKAACELVQPEGVVTVVHAYDVPWQADTYPWFEDFKDICRDLAETLESVKEGAIGSVTYRLLHRARCPVLVITEPEPGRDPSATRRQKWERMEQIPDDRY